MTPERWQRVKDLFHDALERPADERAAFLAETCADDAEARAALEHLLEAHAAAGDFLETPALPEPAVRPPLSGRRFAHYELGPRVGVGGMGEVYKAIDGMLNREVAIKVVTGDEPLAQARLWREAEHASGLNHPSICTIHQVGEAEGLAYIVMEYVEGQPLADVIPAGGLRSDIVVRYASEVAGALAHAHEHGIVHRDLKSSNVMITSDERVKVLDFGLARRLPQGVSTGLETASTAAGVIAGTLSYMAPEVLRGERGDARSDVWAFGVLLHEMLAGEQPFEGQTSFELSSAILNQPPRTLPPTVCSTLAGVVQRCLEKDPARRYASGREVRAALENAPLAAPRIRLRSLLERPPSLLVVALGAVVLLAAGLWVERSRARTGSPSGPAETASVAVLPFQSFGEADGNEYFADGMAEAVTTDLARIPGLLVISRNSAFQYRGRSVDVKKVGADLNVRYVVEGSVQRSGERLRLHVQLIDVSTGYHVWAERYDRELRDVFAVQDDIARSLAHAIRPRLAPSTLAAPPRPPPDFEVYDLYLRGRAAWSRRTPEQNSRAIELYQEAIRRNPGFADAYAGLADALIIQSAQLYAIPRSQALPRAKGAAERALLLDPTLAEAHASLGNLLTKENRWDEAEREFRLAIELKPSYATAHHWYALLVLAQRGHLEEAHREISRAAELDPLAPAVIGSFARILYFQRDYARARLRMERAHELSPKMYEPLLLRSRIDAVEGRRQDALAAARHADGLAPSNPTVRAALARALAESGDVPQAQAILVELERLGEPCVECIVEVQLAVGDLDAAVARVERGGFTPAPSYALNVDPRYDAHRGDPRFRRILQTAHLE
jgi:serine/threonine protein kinase/Tfp pilus assembly protein PilF